MLDQLGAGSVLIIPHGFPESLRHLEEFGIYNVGMVTFRKDERGLAALRRWRAQCIEWCYDRVEGGRFADQAYLDDWPETLDGVVVVDQPGIGLGPWNASRYRYDTSANPVTVDERPLVFYHFHAFRSVGPRLYYDGLREYEPMPRRTRAALYHAYVTQLRQANLDVESLAPSAASLRAPVPFAWRGFLGLARRGHILYDIGGRVLG